MAKFEQNAISQETVVTVWNTLRGHNYVVVGIDKDTNEMLLLKNNCINQDGSVHRSTTRFHIRRAITALGKTKTTSNVSSAVGFRKLDMDEIEKFAKRVGVKNFGPVKKYVLCPSLIDRRSSLVLY